jgi:hypothetical protein
MRKIDILLIASVSSILAAWLGTATAHHSFAMFDLAEHRIIDGEITDWHYNNPHSWLYLSAPDADGELKTWGFEGAAPVHAARQGVTGNTFRKGEHVRVVMSPLRDGRNAGAMCFVIKEDGSIVRPNDGICNAPAVIEAWQTNGWIETGRHLDSHPAVAGATDRLPADAP